MSIIRILLVALLLTFAGAVRAQVVLNMPAPPPKAETSDVAPADDAVSQDDAQYHTEDVGVIALTRFAGYRVTPGNTYGGEMGWPPWLGRYVGRRTYGKMPNGGYYPWVFPNYYRSRYHYGYGYYPYYGGYGYPWYGGYRGYGFPWGGYGGFRFHFRW